MYAGLLIDIRDHDVIGVERIDAQENLAEFLAFQISVSPDFNFSIEPVEKRPDDRFETAHHLHPRPR